eukprot:4753891-Amphidinium_carterae.4
MSRHTERGQCVAANVPEEVSKTLCVRGKCSPSEPFPSGAGEKTMFQGPLFTTKTTCIGGGKSMLV